MMISSFVVIVRVQLCDITIWSHIETTRLACCSQSHPSLSHPKDTEIMLLPFLRKGSMLNLNCKTARSHEEHPAVRMRINSSRSLPINFKFLQTASPFLQNLSSPIARTKSLQDTAFEQHLHLMSAKSHTSNFSMSTHVVEPHLNLFSRIGFRSCSDISEAATDFSWKVQSIVSAHISTCIYKQASAHSLRTPKESPILRVRCKAQSEEGKVVSFSLLIKIATSSLLLFWTDRSCLLRLFTSF